jgi:hypothetical protein
MIIDAGYNTGAVHTSNCSQGLEVTGLVFCSIGSKDSGNSVVTTGNNEDRFVVVVHQVQFKQSRQAK